MAVLPGYGGQVLFAAAVVAELADWTLTINRDNLDTSAFQSSPGWKSNIPGLGDWTATANGSFDHTDSTGQAAIITALLGGTVMTPKFSTNGGTNYYSGTAYPTNVSIKVPVAGKQDFSCTFKGSGAIAYT